jgi:glycosyltransferase involved in cell wall biosynthesis
MSTPLNMNLLLIGNHFSGPNNNKNVWQDLANQLSNSGHKVIISSNQRNKIIRLLDILTTILRRKKDYQVAQIDVFSGPAFILAYLSGKILKRIRKPFILTLHGGNLPKFSLHFPKQVSWLLDQANLVTVPSKYLLDAMKPYRNDLILLPNALDINNYPFIKRVTPKPILIWLRAFHEIYNPELAVRVLHQLHKDLPTLRLIMVGPDKGDGCLHNTQLLVTQFCLENFTEFPGAILKNEVPVWLNKGDIFINTTNYDNTPISVMEAMACGMCIISTNIGGIPYLLDNEINAILVPPNDPDAMAAAVTRILTEPGLAEKLSMNAREKAEQFNWSIILPQWQRLLESVQ